MSVVRPFFPYYGAKWRAALRYPAPVHDTIIEPFCGAAGYSIRHREKQVRLFDLDEFITGTWDYLIRTDGNEIAKLPVIGEFDSVDDVDAEDGARWLIGYWLNPGANAPRKTPSAWARQGNTPGSYWTERVRDRIATQVDLIRHWTVDRADYRTIPNQPATWFIDPPYKEAGKYYRHGPNGIDYADLASFCRTRQGQVLACENTGADWLPFSHLAVIKGTPGKGRTGTSSEVLWENAA